MEIFENLLGVLIVAAFGVLFLRIGCNKPKQKDYSMCQITTGTVLGTEDFRGGRWIVRFMDPNGNEVLAMDDEIAWSTFHPNKWHTPKRNTTEKIYYWPYEDKSTYRINGKRISYEFHFCDETLYDLIRSNHKRNGIIFNIVGVSLMACAFIILLFG